MRKGRRTTRVRRIEPQKFRITHPFHPLTGREFEALSRKEYSGEHRVCFVDKKGRQCEIPLSWTDLAPEDAHTTLSAGKSWFRAADLLELTRLIECAYRKSHLRAEAAGDITPANQMLALPFAVSNREAREIRDGDWRGRREVWSRWATRIGTPVSG